MKQLKNKMLRFLNDNNGLETLEIAAIAIGAVALVAILVVIYETGVGQSSKAKDKMSELAMPGV